MSSKGLALSTVIASWAALLAWIHHIFKEQVTESVMDEIFHVPQTQQYCDLEFQKWDSKITTFPGVYLLAMGYSRALSVFGVGECTLTLLRSFNVILGVCVLVAVFQILRHQHPETSEAKLALMAVSICSLPSHFFFQFLFYTDVAGVLFTMLSFLMTLRKQHLPAALFSIAAILCRQTNAIWAAFVAGVAVLKEFKTDEPNSTPKSLADSSPRKSGETQECAKIERTEGTVSQEDGGLIELFHLLAWMWKEKARVAWKAGPHVVGLIAFAAFVVANKGIVVGDRDAHKPTLHLAQIPYFSVFAAAAFFPLWISKSRVIRDMRLNSWSTVGDLVFLSTCFGAMVVHGTLAHPYLLADNRHYTFYVWKNVLGRLGGWRVVLAPLYALCAYEVGAQMTAQKGWVLATGFWVCAGAALVPSGLLEFRYFTVPAFLYAVHLKPPVHMWVAQQTTVFALVSAVTIYIFCYRPFQWPDGSIARFMW